MQDAACMYVGLLLLRVCICGIFGVFIFCLRFDLMFVCLSSGKEFGSVKLLAVMNGLIVMSCSSPNQPASLVHTLIMLQYIVVYFFLLSP